MKCNIRRWRWFAFFLILSFSIVEPRTFGQVAGGTITGTITDSSGSTVPRAQVSIKNEATDTIKQVLTNEAGYYGAPNLIPGIYTITVSAPGFNTVVRSGLTLTVGAELALNIEMRAGDVTQKVTVVGDTPMVETTTATLSAVVDGTTVRELPLNARDWTQLAALEPGVAIIRTQTPVSSFADRGNRGLGTLMTVAGARPQQNNYRLDGISINDYSNSAPGSSLGDNLGVDAVQEFSVITGNATADYGRSSGGVINAVTRSGNNQFHGSAFEFARNSVLDARNFFDPPSIPPFSRNQFGGTAGGPIRKDHTFFFGAYEGIRQSLSATQVAVVPTAAARNGQLSTGTVVVDPLVKPYLAFYPLPTVSSSGDTGSFTSITSQEANEDFVVARVDHNFSAKDSVHGTYMFDNSKVTSPDLFLTIVQASLTRRQVGTAEYTRTLTPWLVNTVRAGLSRTVTDTAHGIQATLPLANDLALGFVPGSPVGAINVSGVDTYTGGIGASGEVNYHYTSIQAYNDTFWTKGIHSMKFGVSIERLRDNELGTSIPNGAFFFGSLSDFLTNHPASFNSALLGNQVSPRGIRQTIVGTYFEDDVHVKSNLTLNLGLRYEMSSVPTEVHGQLTNLRNLTDTQPHLGSPFFQNPTLRNFEPRIGFSWDPSRTGRTAIRAAFGIYDVLPLAYEYNIVSYLSAPFFERGSIATLPLGAFPKTAFTLLTPNVLRYSHVDFNPRRDYVMNWNLNIQRQLGKNLAALVGYVGTRGVHQPVRSEDVNYVLPALTPQGYLWPVPRNSGTKVNPSVGQVNGLFWAGSSSYHALQTHLSGRVTKNLQLGASYTWAKGIDDASATVTGDNFLNSTPNLPWFDPRLRRGLSDFDIRHNLVINSIWQIPGPASRLAFVRWLAGGWQVGGIYQLSGGLPFTARIGGDPLGLKSTNTYDFPNRLPGPGCNSLVNPGNPSHYIKTECFGTPSSITLLGNLGRNVLIGPGLSNFDFSLFKNNPVRRISESFNVQLRAEFFNVLNHPNFSPPVSNNTLFGFNNGTQKFTALLATAGQISTTSTSSRQIQFGVKLVW